MKNGDFFMYIQKTDEGKNYIEKVEEVNQLITDNPAAIYVLDIRGAEDYEKGHIKGAENIGFKADYEYIVYKYFVWV